MKSKLLLCFIFSILLSLLYGAEIEKNSFQVSFDRKFKPEDAQKVSETGVLPGNVRTFQLPDTMIYDLKTLFQGANASVDCAIIRFKIFSETACKRKIGLSADWWFTGYVNGKLIGTTEPDGELFNTINPCNRGFEISLKKGVNHVAVHTRSGAASWKIGICLFPDVSEWPENQRTRKMIFDILFPVPEKIIGPEVTHVSSDSAVITYFKEHKDSVSVTYWKKGFEQQKRTLSDPYRFGRLPQKNLFRFELKGLESASEYLYELRCVSPGSKVVAGSFRTAPAKGCDHTLVAFSDTQTYYDKRESVIRSMVRKGIFKGADLLVSLGDVDNGFQDFERTYFESFLTPFREEGVRVPFYPVRGNHEYRGTDTDRFTDWFGCPYYSFRYGDVFYIVLDTGEDKPRQKTGHEYALWTDTAVYFKAQREWLRRVIKSDACRSAKYRIVLAHATPFEWESRYYASQIASFADCFYGENPECPIDLWLCADIHSPYRFDPVANVLAGAKRKPTKTRPCELTETDSRNIHFPVYVNDGPNGAGQEFSATRLTVREDSLLVTCIGVDGSVMDQIVIRKGQPFEVLKTTYGAYVPYSGRK